LDPQLAHWFCSFTQRFAWTGISLGFITLAFLTASAFPFRFTSFLSTEASAFLRRAELSFKSSDAFLPYQESAFLRQSSA